MLKFIASLLTRPLPKDVEAKLSARTPCTVCKSYCLVRGVCEWCPLVAKGVVS